jgi:DnaK suppressor protein
MHRVRATTPCWTKVMRRRRASVRIFAYAARQRLAERINRLTPALERMEAGTYGQCAACGGPIEPARLATIPDAETCLRCQAQREQTEPERAA